ncbi:MAG: response regulator [Tannerellaceae bacterium]|jgi:signal transduction histidine kinase/DNA-binding response OmpR family regulator/ligand-binding sensor domain-containing protein|nr:response regulator [Tannerellaceae bacterium]
MKKTLFTAICVFICFQIASQNGRDGALSTISYLFPTGEGGVSTSKITCITQEEEGFIWIGTEDGLNRFDGYDFTTYRKRYADSLSLVANHITALFYDSRHILWVATVGGLVCYDPSRDGFVRAPLAGFEEAARLGRCEAILEDRLGRLWFAVSGYGALRYSPVDGGCVLFSAGTEGVGGLCSNNISVMAEDVSGRVWLGSKGDGISVYDDVTGRVTGFDTSNSALEGNTILDLKCLGDGDMLVAVRGRGLMVFDMERGVFLGYNDVFNTPGRQAVTCVAEDMAGNILVGTLGNGVFAFDRRRRTLDAYGLLGEFHSLLDDANISCLYFGKRGYLWVGIKYKGLFVAGSERSGFRSFRRTGDRDHSLSYNYVTGMATDKDGDLWIATGGGGLNRYRPSTGTFKHYIYNSSHRGLRDNVVLSVFCDSRGRIWAGTFMGGLCRFDHRTETFTHIAVYKDGKSGGQHTGYVESIAEDSSGMLWLGLHGGGLVRYDTGSGAFRTFVSFGVFEGRDVGGGVNILFCDSRDRLWIGTDNGLSRLDIDMEVFTAFSLGGEGDMAVYSVDESPEGIIRVGAASGLYAHDIVRDRFLKIYPEGDGETAVVNGLVHVGDEIWLSTNNGIVSYSVHGGAVKTYTRRNSGLGGDEFLSGAYHKSDEGEIFFGGVTGLSAFFPGDVKDSVTIQKVYITGLHVGGEKVAIGGDVNGRVLLERNINETKKIRLRHSENFRLDFVAMGSYKSYSTYYTYKLEGFDRDWSLVDYSSRSVTYTNLNPGQYTFLIKASSDPRVFGGEVTRLIIEIDPPLWVTPWAWMLYVLMFFGLIYAVVRFTTARMRDKNELSIERIRVRQQEELNHVRTNFFTNISHEFRTPLTLIIGPLKRLIDEDIDDDRKKAGHLILRNAERLQHLINQILDLNKIEEGRMRLHVRKVDLVDLVANSVAIFSDLMKQKHITFTYNAGSSHIEIWFDPDMLDKCLNNILYNAFKFTPGGGEIRVATTIDDHGDAVITVSDTGIGMESETVAHIFDRFFQGGNTNEYAGTGVGMHLTKTIIDLHRGKIEVESEIGKGSSFRLTIRKGRSHFTEDEMESAVHAAPRREESPFSDTLPAAKPKKKKKAGDNPPLVLLVEDNSDMRFYIRQELSQCNLVIEEAADGKEGLGMAVKLLPDLIVTDLMMPVMNGIELCRAVKAADETSHIPVIILTAQDDIMHKIEGVESGADSFITKPFNVRYLRVRIEKLIEMRRAMKERFSKSIHMDAQELTLTSIDERLLRKSIDYVRANVENPELSVEAMSRELGMSRTHLHRKLKALTGKSPVEFIRMIRMKQAAYLLTTGKLSISEVAYMVGYNTPSYFSNSFNMHFGMSPTAYIEQSTHAAEDDDQAL